MGHGTLVIGHFPFVICHCRRLRAAWVWRWIIFHAASMLEVLESGHSRLQALDAGETPTLPG